MDRNRLHPGVQARPFYQGYDTKNNRWVTGQLVCDTERFNQPDFHVFLTDRMHVSGSFVGVIFVEVDPKSTTPSSGMSDSCFSTLYFNDVVVVLCSEGDATTLSVGYVGVGKSGPSLYDLNDDTELKFSENSVVCKLGNTYKLCDIVFTAQCLQNMLGKASIKQKEDR